jgi:hypothetical protein
MAKKLRSGEIEAVRLHRWAELRYGYAAVAPQWRDALLDSRRWFSSKFLESRK